MEWQSNVLESWDEIRPLLAGLRRIAVLGIRSEQFADRPAHGVPATLAMAGLEIVPVPVYEPGITQILGRTVYRSLVSIPEPIDLVDVFRRAVDIPMHLGDLLAKRPSAVWFQSGIRNDTVAEQLARAGIKVVQDRCLMVDYLRFQRG